MPCYHPLRVYRSSSGRLPNGKWPIVFNAVNGLHDDESVLQIPCGQCIGCRLDRSKNWAIRCMHESKMYDNNQFITLTYNDETYSQQCPTGSLNKRDFVLFMKKLRKKFGRVRFFHCGEYGENNKRAHHHACIFGLDIPDKKIYKSEGNIKLYTSEILEKMWGFGYVIIGEVTFESAAYVARYVTKKITGKLSKIYYNGKEPEYCTMSRRPGIGMPFLETYGSDVYNNDTVLMRDLIPCKPPRYYDKIYDTINPKRLEELKAKRKLKINPLDQTSRRLKVREEVTFEKMKNWRRQYDKGELRC